MSIKTESEALIREDYSPEQVVNTLKQQGKSTVSIERIYQHIWHLSMSLLLGRNFHAPGYLCAQTSLYRRLRDLL